MNRPDLGALHQRYVSGSIKYGETIAIEELIAYARHLQADHQRPEFQELGALYTEDGYCVACGNGHWKAHMPECKIAELNDRIQELETLVNERHEEVVRAERIADEKTERIQELEAALKPFADKAYAGNRFLVDTPWENAARVLRGEPPPGPTYRKGYVDL